MKAFLSAALLFLGTSTAFAVVTKDDVRKLLVAGISEETILHFIHRNAPSAPLSPEDITELKNAGAGDKVLNAMLEASKASASSYSSESTPAPSITTYYSSYSTYDYPYYYPYSFYYPYYPYYYGYPFFSIGFSNVHCHDHHHGDFHHDHSHAMPPPTHVSPHGGGAGTFHGGGSHGGGGHGGHR